MNTRVLQQFEDDIINMWREIHIATDARSELLPNELRKLATWCQLRADGNHNPDTTMTMLQRKVEDIRQRLMKAGAKAIHEHRATPQPQ